MIGSSIGAYRIDSKLGEGGMGVVYRATDTELDRAVAIKTLIAGQDPDSEARFLREARLASRLQHPSIVTIYHFGILEHSRYIVMEFVEGKTLKKIINGKPMPVVQLCEMALQVGDALTVAHEKGVVHRDMKSENVMVTPRGQVKILDFGLAKLNEPDPSGNQETAVFKTQEGLVVGTVSHMSPEQAMGKDVDARSDIFSFGIVLYEMATGEIPFNAPSAQATMAQVLNHNPAPVSLLNPEIPPELDNLIQQCLQKDRMLRPAAGEVVFRLKNVLASLSAKNLSSPEIRMVSGTVAAPGSVVTGAYPAAPAPSAGRMAPVSGSRPAMAPASGPALTPVLPSSGTTAAAPAPPVPGSAKAVYYGVRAVRIILAIATLSVPLSFFLHFVISGGLIRPQLVEGTAVMKFMTAVVTPALRLAESVFTFRTVYQGWNFVLLGFGILGFVVRQLVLLPVERVEHWAKGRVVRAKIAAPVAITVASTERRSGDRLAMLREYAEAKKMLFQEKRRLAFLSIGVVGASQLKAGEDKLVVEHAFSEYRKFVERELAERKAWKHSWMSESVLVAFDSPDQAVEAAQHVLGNLSWFNDGVHQLRSPFRLRCGVNSGEVVFPDSKRIEEINDETIDLTLRLQESAEDNSLWLTREMLAMLREQVGFQAMTMQQVNGHAIIAWRPVNAPAARVS